jgi:hypothetical protein
MKLEELAAKVDKLERDSRVRVGPDAITISDLGELVFNRLGTKILAVTVNDGYTIYNAQGVLIGQWDPDGNLRLGLDLSTPDSTNIVLFNKDQLYNGEAMYAGDLLFGSNSAGKANLKWEKATGQLRFRAGQTAAVLLDTDGSFYAASRRLEIRSDGNIFMQTSIYSDPTLAPALYWRTYNSGTRTVGDVWAHHESATARARVWLEAYHNPTAGSIPADPWSLGCTVGLIVIKPNDGHLAQLMTHPRGFEIDNAPLRLKLYNTVPTSTNGGVNLYHRSGRLVVQYRDGGTTRYLFLNLSGTNTVWRNTTGAI